MRNIRYLLAFSNIRPTAADKDRMAEALEHGAENDGQTEENEKTPRKRRKLLFAIIAADIVIALIFAAYLIISKLPSPKPPETTAPAATENPDIEYTLIKPMYQNDKTYGLLRDLILRTSWDGDALKIYDYKAITASFNAKKSDYENVFTSLFAFAEPDMIELHEEPNRSSSNVCELILASNVSGTFEVVVSFDALIEDGEIYLFDWGTLSSSSSAPLFGLSSEDTNVRDGGYIKAGYICSDGPDGVSYMINTDLIRLVHITKIRIEGGLPVIYDCYMTTAVFDRDGGEHPDFYGVVLAMKETGNGDERYYVIDNDGSFSAGEKSLPVISRQFDNDKAPVFYFPSAPQSMRKEICDIINYMRCDWFLYLYSLDGDPVGVPLYLSADGESLHDIEGKEVSALFYSYYSLFPTFDLSAAYMPEIVVYRQSSGFESLSADFSATPDEIMAEYEKNCYTFTENITFCTVGDKLYLCNTRFSVDLSNNGATGYSYRAVTERSQALLELLGIGYTERIDGTSGYYKFRDATGGITQCVADLYGYHAARNPEYEISDLYVCDFTLTGNDGRRRIVSHDGAEYRVDTLYGYRLHKCGFITDLDNVIIGIYDVKNGLTFFRDPKAPLYVVSDDSGLLYIGRELPGDDGEFLPFESVNLPYGDGKSAVFRYGYLDGLVGPYAIPTGCFFAAYGEEMYLRFNVEVPEFAYLSYFEYDGNAQTYNKVTLGSYGDRFVQTCGGFSYRKELSSSTSRKTRMIHIKYDDGYYK